MPILLTAWDAKLSAVRPVIESGADDLLLHPFSTTQVAQRIHGLIHHRKPFVVTEDYFGPDRRTMAARRDDPASIIVPNALRATASGRRDAAPSAARINQALGELRRLKLRNLSRRIWYFANRLQASEERPAPPGQYERELSTLRTSIAVYRKTLIATDRDELSTLCNSLAGVLAGLFGKQADAKALLLLEKNAMALRVASKLDHETGHTGVTISDTVGRTSRVQGDLVRAVMG